MWIQVRSMDSDVWQKDGKTVQPQFKRVTKRGRQYMVSVPGFPDLVGRVGKVSRVWHEDDGDFLAVQFGQEEMQTCGQDYWLFRPEDVEEIPQGDSQEAIAAVMVSWLRTLE